MKRLIATVVLAAAAIAVPACREEGALEKAGREMDEAVDKLQHGDEGALEKAGRKVDETIDEAKEKLEEAG